MFPFNCTSVVFVRKKSQYRLNILLFPEIYTAYRGAGGKVDNLLKSWQLQFDLEALSGE